MLFTPNVVAAEEKINQIYFTALKTWTHSNFWAYFSLLLTADISQGANVHEGKNIEFRFANCLSQILHQNICFVIENRQRIM